MLDARFVREHPEEVAAAMKARKASWDMDAFMALDAKRRDLIKEVEQLQAARNAASKQIGKLMGQGKREEAEAAKQEVREVNDRIAVLDAQRAATDDELTLLLMKAPNIPAASTPFGESEDDNPEVRRWGTPREFDFDKKDHWDLGPALGIIDFERGVKLAGSRFILLGGMGARLERAIINFMLDTHISRGYKEWWPPILANKETLTGTGQLPKFEEDLFKTTGGMYL
ncbi:MAG: serine--tRNA ligase, partial [Coriobacteriales bacterium]|nr:serine--tRNA ligase [Coriobacteriales bacterium]